MKQFFTKKKIIAGAVILVVLLLGAGVVFAATTWSQITSNQMDLFKTAAPIPSETPKATADPGTQTPGATDGTDEPSNTAPVATIDPQKEIEDQADQAMMKDTLHVLLIGVDYSEERETWKNKLNFNSDVMLLLVINFKQNKVDMISFPRDTYSKIYNLDNSGGNNFYKLNFALAAGGGINDQGFMNVCKSVEGLLDKKVPPIDYYIAVTMPAVKELTDAVGGVEYNVDIDFRIQGREYKKGLQHMNGQAVLDYCRVRKNSGTGYISGQQGDLNRVNRQKKMLVTVFKKLQSDATIFTVPKILTSMQDKVFTNMNYKQLAALALFGKNLKEDKITMRTLPNTGTVNIFNYNFVLQDQAGRVKMIKEIYGVNADRLYKFDSGYARLLWAYMKGETWMLEIVKWRNADAAKPLEQQKLIIPEDNAKLDALINSTQKLMLEYRDTLYSSSKPVVSSGQWNELNNQVEALKKQADSMFTKAGYKANWKVTTPEVLNMAE